MLLFLGILPVILSLAFPMAAASCRDADRASSASAGQDRLSNEAAPLVDHHQHLLSPAGVELVNARGRKEKPVTSEQLVAMLDAAGIQRAVVLSDAYYFDSPLNEGAVCATATGKFGLRTTGQRRRSRAFRDV
jgi:hypothetical protein